MAQIAVALNTDLNATVGELLESPLPAVLGGNLVGVHDDLV
jgi:hypothetical protein